MWSRIYSKEIAGCDTETSFNHAYCLVLMYFSLVIKGTQLKECPMHMEVFFLCHLISYSMLHCILSLWLICVV